MDATHNRASKLNMKGPLSEILCATGPLLFFLLDVEVCARESALQHHETASPFFPSQNTNTLPRIACSYHTLLTRLQLWHCYTIVNDDIVLQYNKLHFSSILYKDLSLRSSPGTMRLRIMSTSPVRVRPIPGSSFFPRSRSSTRPCSYTHTSSWGRERPQNRRQRPSCSTERRQMRSTHRRPTTSRERRQ